MTLPLYARLAESDTCSTYIEPFRHARSRSHDVRVFYAASGADAQEIRILGGVVPEAPLRGRGSAHPPSAHGVQAGAPLREPRLRFRQVPRCMGNQKIGTPAAGAVLARRELTGQK